MVKFDILSAIDGNLIELHSVFIFHKHNDCELNEYHHVSTDFLLHNNFSNLFTKHAMCVHLLLIVGKKKGVHKQYIVYNEEQIDSKTINSAIFIISKLDLINIQPQF